MLELCGEQVGADLYKDLRDCVDIHTPLGPLLLDISLPLDDGSVHSWTVCNPFALLHILCRISLQFVHLLTACLRNAGKLFQGSLALYSDETTHGNVQRHDSVNEMQCIYWGVPQLPSWFRQRKYGWFYFGFLRVDTQKQVRGGLSAVMRHTLRLFYNPDWFSFAQGIQVPVGTTGHAIVIQLKFMCFVQDEKAHAGVCSVKGASGNRCCLECRNILNIDPEKFKAIAIISIMLQLSLDNSTSTPKNPFSALRTELQTMLL